MKLNRKVKLTAMSDTLLTRVETDDEIPVGDFVNSAILMQFLPIAEPLRIESLFLMQEMEAGRLDAWDVKQCISRGVRWLKTHPVKDSNIIKWIFDQFPFGANETGEISTCNEYVQAEMDMAYKLLKERVSDYEKSKGGYDGLVVDILANWECLWQESVVYDVLATIVYNQEPKQDFDWYDGVNVLYVIDRAAWRQWCDAC